MWLLVWVLYLYKDSFIISTCDIFVSRKQKYTWLLTIFKFDYININICKWLFSLVCSVSHHIAFSDHLCRRIYHYLFNVSVVLICFSFLCWKEYSHSSYKMRRLSHGFMYSPISVIALFAEKSPLLLYARSAIRSLIVLLSKSTFIAST